MYTHDYIENVSRSRCDLTLRETVHIGWLTHIIPYDVKSEKLLQFNNAILVLLDNNQMDSKVQSKADIIVL